MAALTGKESMVRLSNRTPAFRTTMPHRCLRTQTASMSSRAGADLAFSSVGRAAFNRVELPSSLSRTGTRMVTTMAAKVTGKIKLALVGGKANPSPPVGPALGAKGVNIMAFCKQYNAETQKMAGEIVPVEITVYEDRSFTFVLKTPPASALIKKAAGITLGSPKPGIDLVGQINMAQVKEIAIRKLPDTNATKVESVMKMIKGTARNMGVTVVE